MNIVAEKIFLRLVTLGDIRLLFEWRNAPESRKNFGNKEEINWISHQSWFAKKLSEPDTRIYIGVAQNESLGVIRFEKDNERALVSVIVRPGCLGKGIGTTLIQKGTATYIKDMEQSMPIIAKINKDNVASQRSFEKSNYVRVATIKNQYIYAFNEISVEKNIRN